MPPPSRNRPAARVWLPLAVSLALHALFALGAVQFTSSDEARADGPVPVDAVVFDPGIITLDDPAGGGDGRRAAKAAPQPDDPSRFDFAFASKVHEPQPVMPPVPQPLAGSGPGMTGGEHGFGAGNGGGGGEGHATGLLRAPATARKVVYVIDRSLSMGLNDALALAKRELLAGVAALPADARFGVILYNGQAEPLALQGQNGLLPVTQANRAAMARLVNEVLPQGRTDHLGALRRALAMGADTIFLVTDADDLTADQARNVALLNRNRAVIHAVELSNGSERREETPLQRLARLSGGTYRVVPPNREINDAVTP